MKPNFFIAGAPKCGTSAIHQYLDDRTDVFMSDPKEPAFWSKKEFGGLLRRRSIPLSCVDDYLHLFEKATTDHTIVGEASTLYLAAKSAVPEIIQFNPNSKFLVMLRNPVDFVVSFHRQKTFDMQENVNNFETAWQLQEKRRNGKSLPPLCHEPEVLQYRELGRFGTQIQLLLDEVHPDQVHVVLLEDFTKSPAETFEGILKFLQLPSEGRTEFPRVNDARAIRFRFLQMLYSQDAPIVGPLVRLARRIGSQSSVLRKTWHALRTTPGSKRGISNETRRELVQTFDSEISILEDCLRRDLSTWRVVA